MSESVMNEIFKRLDEIFKRLDLIGAKLGEGGAFAWEAYMRQAFWVDGWGQLAVVVLLCLIIVVLVKTALWCGGRKPTPGYHPRDLFNHNMTVANIEDEAGRIVSIGFCATGVAMCLGFALVGLWDGIGHIINPAYYALMDLAKLVGK